MATQQDFAQAVIEYTKSIGGRWEPAGHIVVVQYPLENGDTSPVATGVNRSPDGEKWVFLQSSPRLLAPDISEEHVEAVRKKLHWSHIELGKDGCFAIRVFRKRKAVVDDEYCEMLKEVALTASALCRGTTVKT